MCVFVNHESALIYANIFLYFTLPIWVKGFEVANFQSRTVLPACLQQFGDAGAGRLEALSYFNELLGKI